MLLVGLPSAVQAQSYPLVCRGGPEMALEARFELIIGGQTGTIVKVQFRPAPQPGFVAEPGAGECTWTDRALNAAEPSTFTIVAPNIGFSFDLGGDGRIKESDGAPLLILGGQSVAERVGYNRVLGAILKGQLFTVLVANNGQTLSVSGVQ
jgi:hypothetical protein